MWIVSILSLIIFCNSWCSAQVIVDTGRSRRTEMCAHPKCNNNTEKTLNSEAAGCRCDAQCHMYGDCCSDAPAAKQMNFTSLPLVNCTSDLPTQNSIYTINWCNDPSKKMYIGKCQMSSNYRNQTNNLTLKVPVTDTSTNITYGNVACARCHNVKSLVFWSVNVTCPSLNLTFPVTSRFVMGDFFTHNRPDLRDKLKFNNVTASWQFTNGGQRNENCTLIPVPPLENANIHLRSCEPNLVSTCPSGSAVQADECPGFISNMISRRSLKFYRNIRCAMCNRETRFSLTCPSLRRNQGSSQITILPLFSNRSLTQPSSTPNTLTSAPTAPQSTSPAASSYSSPTPTTSSTPSTPGLSVKIVDKIKKKRAYLFVQFNKDCREILNEMSFMKVAAETIYYQTINRTFVKNTQKIDGTSIEICDMNEEVPQTEFKRYSTNYWWFVFTSIVYDVLLLGSTLLNVIYLYMYATSKVSDTLYSKALASYSFVLLLALWSAIIDSIFTLSNTTNARFCVIHYFFLQNYGHLAARFWLVSLAFEMTCFVLEVDGGSSKSDQRRKWTRFTVYSWLSWSVPGIIIAVRMFQTPGVVADACSIGIEMDLESFFLEYSVTACISMTSALYLSSVYVIFVRVEVLRKLSEVYGIDYNLFTALTACSLVVNLSYLINEFVMFPAWFLFSASNFLLAISIYLHSPIHTALLNNVKLYFDRHFKT